MPGKLPAKLAQMKYNWKKILIAVTLTVLASIAFLASAHAAVYRGKIYPGVRVETLDVGGMTPSDAARSIKRVFPSAGQIDLVYKDRSWPIDLADLGAEVRAAHTAEQAFDAGRGGGLLNNLAVRYSAARRGRVIEAAWKLNNANARRILEKTAEVIDQPPVSAQLLINMGEVDIQPHQDGRRMLVPETLKDLKSAFFRGQAEVKAAVEEQRPEKTTQDIKDLRIERQISEFSTTLSPTRDGRRHNIELAMAKLNDVYIEPGAMFSFNQTVGARTREAGFKDAPVIEAGNLVPGIGGGICQVSTTLYNAAMLVGLPITERTLHSNYISNYPAGRDSTVADGLLDLKFRNDTEGTLLIKTYVLSNAVGVKIYGPETGRKVWFSEPEISNIVPFPSKVETDTALPEGITVREQAGVDGRTVQVRRKVTLGEKVLIDEVVTSRYTPRTEFLRVAPELESPEGSEEATAGPDGDS
jgi:vancomycin resistance protein YoaR